MILHYLTTTFRYLRRHPMFSLINIGGLAVALCAVYFAFLYVQFERSYDSFNTNRSRIYRLSADVHTPNGINYETSPAALASAAASSVPGIKTAARIFLDYYIVQKDHENYGEETIAYADPSVFEIFSFPLLKGNPQTVFNAPYAMVLSETAAKKYFGTIDCLDSTLILDKDITATVTGIMKDIPVGSHFRTDIFLSMSSLIRPGTNWMEDWSRFGFSTYLLLDEHTDIRQLERPLQQLAKDHPLKNNLRYSLVAEPLTTLYLQGTARSNKAGATATGSYRDIYIFSIAALFVLGIACFNFINLTTALSLKRAKEIGVRKVMGASGNQLIFQFLSDALIVSLLAFLISLLLGTALLPWFNALAGKTIATSMFGTSGSLVLLPAIAVATGLLAGIYPAFFLSGFRPSASLKGKFTGSAKGLFLRKSLVVTQFTISIILIASTLVVYRQLRFMKNENLGFKKEHNLVIDFHYDPQVIAHADAVEEELAKIPGITCAGMSSAIPGRPNKKFPTLIEDAGHQKISLQNDAYFIDYRFIRQYGIEVIAGRAFSKDFPSDAEEGLIVNETLARKAGYANVADIIGRPFSQRGKNGHVIGVVKDFHFHSLHEEIQPLTMMLSNGFYTFLTLTLSPGNTQETLHSLEKKWAALAPGMPMISFFTDDIFNAQYEAESRFGKLFTCFSIMAIFISCLGLLGLTAFNAIQRTREVGIRKVLGASRQGIFVLLTKDFVFLVGLSFLVATPIAILAMESWLSRFPYRITLTYPAFLIAGLIALLVAILTTGYFAIRSAQANPVQSLRTE